MLKQFIFTESGAYGEFVLIVAANSIEEAVLVSGKPFSSGSYVEESHSESITNLKWNKNALLITNCPSDIKEPCIIFSGGGDCG